MKHRFDHSPYVVPHNESVKIGDFPTNDTNGIRDKKHAKDLIKEDIKTLAEAQNLLYAAAERSVLIVLQAMDAAGKDSTIKHVMSGVNPQGCGVVSFKKPTSEELAHDFLWRCYKEVPAKGRITIFNRSYYEEVLVVKVHPEYLKPQKLPSREGKTTSIWEERYEDINAFEHYLDRNGVKVIKFFLNVSKEEQKERFMERLNNPEKHWKFNPADVEERKHWDDYQQAYEDMLNATSTPWAPWYVIPADYKWFMRSLVADIIVANVESMNLKFPEVSAKDKQKLAQSRIDLDSEG
ncbi:MAG: polyphosphate kinase 2 family protein [Bacteroidota bacterium]